MAESQKEQWPGELIRPASAQDEWPGEIVTPAPVQDQWPGELVTPAAPGGLTFSAAGQLFLGGKPTSLPIAQAVQALGQPPATAPAAVRPATGQPGALPGETETITDQPRKAGLPTFDRMQIPGGTTQLQNTGKEESWPGVLLKSVAAGPASIGTAGIGIDVALKEVKGEIEKAASNLIVKASSSLGLPGFIGAGYLASRQHEKDVERVAAVKTEADLAKSITEYLAPQTGQNLAKQYAAGILQSTTASIPQMLLPGVGPYVSFFLTSFGNKYLQMREAKQDIWTSLATSTAVGASESLTEVLPIGQIKKVGTPIIKRLLASVALEIPGEEINTIVESVADKLTIRKDMTWGDYWKSFVDTAVVTIGQSLLVGGAAHVAYGRQAASQPAAAQPAGLPAAAPAPAPFVPPGELPTTQKLADVVPGAAAEPAARRGLPEAKATQSQATVADEMGKLNESSRNLYGKDFEQLKTGEQKKALKAVETPITVLEEADIVKLADSYTGTDEWESRKGLASEASGKYVSDGRYMIIDENVAKEIRNQYWGKEEKRKIKAYQKSGNLSFDEAQKVAKEHIEQEKKGLKPFPYEQVIPKSKGSEARYIGAVTQGDYTSVFYTDGKETVAVDAKILKFIRNYFPDAKVTIIDDMSPVQFWVGDKLKAVLMPRKHEGPKPISRGLPPSAAPAAQQGKPLRVYRPDSDIAVTNTQGKAVTLKAGQDYHAYDLGNGKIRLKDGKQVTVWEGELDKLKGLAVRPGEVAGGGQPARGLPKPNAAITEATDKIEAITKPRKERGTTWLGRLAKQAINRVQTEQGKEMLRALHRTQVSAVVATANDLKEINFWKGISDEDTLILADMLEGKTKEHSEKDLARLHSTAQAIKGMFERSHDTAAGLGMEAKTEEGWRPLQKVAQYFPRVISHDIAKKLDIGLRQLNQRVAELRQQGVKSPQKQAILEMGRMKDNRFSELITYLEARGMKVPPSKFFRILNTMVNRTKPGLGSHLERARTAQEMPAHFYNRNAREVVTAYLMEAHRRIAETQEFGQKNQKLTKVMKELSATSPNDAKVVKEIFQNTQGHGEGTNIGDQIAALQSMTKIGLGTATIPNLTQWLISTFSVGPFRNLKSALTIAFQPGKAKQIHGESGVIMANTMKMLLGFKTEGVLGKINEKLLAWNGFRGVNKALLFYSSVVGNTYVNDLLRSTQSFGARKAWAYAQLEQFGIKKSDVSNGKTSETKRLEAIYNFSTDMQLQHNILKEPIWFNDPKYRGFAILKRFGYKQAVLIKDQMFKQLKYGNPLPIFYLLIGGVLGGEFVHWAREMLDRGIKWATGQKFDYSRWDRKDYKIYMRVLDDLAWAGSLGIYSDFMRWRTSKKGEPQAPNIGEQIAFQVTHPLASDVINLGKAIDKGLKEGPVAGLQAGVRAITPIGRYVIPAPGGKSQSRSLPAPALPPPPRGKIGSRPRLGGGLPAARQLSGGIGARRRQ